MAESEFDHYAEEYRSLHASNIKMSGEQPEFFAEYKVGAVAEQLRIMGLNAGDILDFGSGTGGSIPHFRKLMPKSSLVCADVSRKSLAVSEQRFAGDAEFHAIQSGVLALAYQKFDVIFSACVFHHIPHAEHVGWLQQLRAVARPGGMLALFEHNPWNPLTVRAVNTCPFDINARLLSANKLRRHVVAAGWRDVEVRYHVFFPAPLARLRPLEKFLGWLPLGAQYSVYARA